MFGMLFAGGAYVAFFAMYAALREPIMAECHGRSIFTVSIISIT